MVGLYEGKRQVGFSRTFSDGVGFAYLADVYVLPELRGRGLGVELVRETVERGPFAHCRWLLHTADAHAFYERFGFHAPDELLMTRDASNLAAVGAEPGDLEAVPRGLEAVPVGQAAEPGVELAVAELDDRVAVRADEVVMVLRRRRGGSRPRPGGG